MILASERLQDGSRIESRYLSGVTSFVLVAPDGSETKETLMRLRYLRANIGLADAAFEGAEKVLSLLSMAVASVERLEDATPEQVARFRALVSELDGHVVRKWRA